MVPLIAMVARFAASKLISAGINAARNFTSDPNEKTNRSSFSFNAVNSTVLNSSMEGAFNSTMIKIISGSVIGIILLIILIIIISSLFGSDDSAGPVISDPTASSSGVTCAGAPDALSAQGNGSSQTSSASCAYNSNNWLLPSNFGNPQCDFTKEKLKALLEQLDPQNAIWWFDKVISCESGYNPNAWLDPNSRPSGDCTPDAGGAWGLFQTGSSSVLTPSSLYGRGHPCHRRLVGPQDVNQGAGLGIGIWGHGGTYDRGDIDWCTQAQYAVKLLRSRGSGYWACAK